MKSAALLLLLFGQTAADQAVPYTVAGSPDAGLEFVVERYPVAKMADLEAAMLADANRRCSPKIARYSSYSSNEGTIAVNGATVPAVLRYSRLMLCVDPVERGTRAPANFTPSSDDTAAALKAFDDYFAAFDAQRVDLVQRLSDGPPVSDTRVADMLRSFNADVGVVKRNPQEMHWIANPPDQPHDGVFVDIAYYQTLPNAITLCGMALFYRADATTYRLSRNMMHGVPTPADGKSPPCTLYRVEAKAGTAAKP